MSKVSPPASATTVFANQACVITYGSNLSWSTTCYPNFRTMIDTITRGQVKLPYDIAFESTVVPYLSAIEKAQPALTGIVFQHAGYRGHSLAVLSGGCPTASSQLTVNLNALTPSAGRWDSTGGQQPLFDNNADSFIGANGCYPQPNEHPDGAGVFHYAEPTRLGMSLLSQYTMLADNVTSVRFVGMPTIKQAQTSCDDRSATCDYSALSKRTSADPVWQWAGGAQNCRPSVQETRTEVTYAYTTVVTMSTSWNVTLSFEAGGGDYSVFKAGISASVGQTFGRTWQDEWRWGDTAFSRLSAFTKASIYASANQFDTFSGTTTARWPALKRQMVIPWEVTLPVPSRGVIWKFGPEQPVTAADCDGF